MSQASVRKKFIFNSKIDREWLYSLYEDDYAYIAEVFSNSLDAIKEGAPIVASAFESDDIDSLRKATHKLKPVFGFAGLLDHQDMISRFEHACMNSNTVANLTMQYIELTGMITEGRGILQDEYKRLTAFIS